MEKLLIVAAAIAVLVIVALFLLGYRSHDMGGRIRAEETGYLAGTFTSSIFRFVDDLEVRIDSDRNTVHLRSASRVGRSDLGANRKRVERLKASFHSSTS